jgi:pimeloyl-ACP methyl ester carboxylesterase
MPGFKIVAMEHLQGTPRTWMVVIPDACAATDTVVQILLFFRPETFNPYRNTDDIEFGPFNMFVKSPEAPPSYMRASPRAWVRYPAISFADQIVKSKKQLILAFPMPRGNKAGTAADFGTLPSPEGMQQLARLIRGLWQEGHVGKGSGQPPRVVRLAVSGFSLGGDVAQQFWANHRQSIHELYLFDPGAGLRGDLGAWIQADITRRLCLVCTQYSMNAALQLQRSSPKGLVQVFPDWSEYFYDVPVPAGRQDNRLYIDAHGGAELDKHLPPGCTRATELTNIAMLRDSPASKPPFIELEGKGDVDGKTTKRAFENIAHHEAALFLEGLLALGTGKKDTAHHIETELFDKIVRNEGNEQPRVAAHRHSWAVVGGERVDGEFRGYLRRCLDHSHFV